MVNTRGMEQEASDGEAFAVAAKGRPRLLAHFSYGHRTKKGSNTRPGEGLNIGARGKRQRL